MYVAYILQAHIITTGMYANCIVCSYTYVFVNLYNNHMNVAVII